MSPILPILARNSEDSMIKLIFGAIVVAFWIGGAIISAINKRVQDSKRRASYGQMPPTFQRPIPPPVPNRAGFAGGKAAKKAAKRKAVAAAAAPQPQARVAQAAPLAQPAPPASAARPAQAAQHPPCTIARLLRRPETLRAALILNEVLSPPLSLRNSVQSGRSVE